MYTFAARNAKGTTLATYKTVYEAFNDKRWGKDAQVFVNVTGNQSWYRILYLEK